MKKIACIVFEVSEGETVHGVVKQIKECLSNRETTNLSVVSLNTSNDWRTSLECILNKFGVSSRLDGYNYLFYAMEAIQESKPMHNLRVGKVYSYVEERINKSSSCIERGIRTVTEKIIYNNSSKVVEEILNISNVAKLTPSIFIAALANLLFGAKV